LALDAFAGVGAVHALLKALAIFFDAEGFSARAAFALLSAF